MEPLPLTERSELARLVIAKLVEVAPASVVLPLKTFAFENVLAVVVEKALEKTPVALLYESGKIAERLELEILPLKDVQSEDARKPFAVLLACEIESADPERESGPLIVSVLSAPTPLPTRIPVGVVEPVPPKPMPRVPKTLVASEKVEVAETRPLPLAWRKPAPVPRVKFVVEAEEAKSEVAVKAVEDAVVKVFCPLQVLLFRRSVEDAALMV